MTVQLVGGLGNQLFQYATGRAVSLRSGGRLQLEISTYRADKQRAFELGPYSIDAEVVDWKALKTLHVERVSSRVDRMIRWRYRRAPVLQSIGHFDPAVLDAAGNVLLIGWWMSEQHFSDATATIRAELQPSAVSTPAVERWVDLICERTAVSLHVRRGDFLWTTGHQRLFNPLGKEYYEDAARRVVERVGSDVRFFVFSDDPKWCAQHLDLPSEMAIVSGHELSHHDDLHLMSLCDHHVIANSTFSWWGAWLGEARGKADGEAQRQVVAPREYYTEPALNAQIGMYPDRWTVM